MTGAPCLVDPRQRGRLCRRLGVDDLTVRGRGDADGTRLHGFRDLAHKVDMQEAVLHFCGLDLDEIRKPEYALERPCRYALIEKLRFAGIGFANLFTLHGEAIFLCLEGKLRLGKSRNRDGNAIRILASPLDIVGRIGWTTLEAHRLVEHRKQPVKADGGAIKRGKIECTHGISSFEATCRGSADRPDRVCAAGWPARPSIWGGRSSLQGSERHGYAPARGIVGDGLPRLLSAADDSD